MSKVESYIRCLSVALLMLLTPIVAMSQAGTTEASADINISQLDSIITSPNATGTITDYLGLLIETNAIPPGQADNLIRQMEALRTVHETVEQITPATPPSPAKNNSNTKAKNKQTTPTQPQITNNQPTETNTPSPAKNAEQETTEQETESDSALQQSTNDIIPAIPITATAINKTSQEDTAMLQAIQEQLSNQSRLITLMIILLVVLLAITGYIFWRMQAIKRKRQADREQLNLLNDRLNNAEKQVNSVEHQLINTNKQPTPIPAQTPAEDHSQEYLAMLEQTNALLRAAEQRIAAMETKQTNMQTAMEAKQQEIATAMEARQKEIAAAIEAKHQEMEARQTEIIAQHSESVKIIQELQDAASKPTLDTRDAAANPNKYMQDFQKNYPDFLEKLLTKGPSITEHDQLLCMLIALGVGKEQLQSIFSITPESLKAARYRLRTKLELERQDKLEDILQSML